MKNTERSLRYTAGLTGEPFLFSESRILSKNLASGEEINTLSKRNLSENLIMHRKVGSLKRVNTPLFRRLSVLSTGAVEILASGDIDSAKIILLIAIAKTDRLFRDFLIDIYADKLAVKSNKIIKADIERYFESVFLYEPYLRDRTEQTKAKLKQQLMKIMAESGLVKKVGDSFVITRPVITSKLANQLIADGDTVYLKALGGVA